MNELKELMNISFNLLNYDLDILGYTFSFWSIIVWTFIGSICLIVLNALFDFFD